MNNDTMNYRKSHHVLGLILGILGVCAALLLVFLFGVIGGGLAVILGGIGLLLGIQARKSGKGWGAIIVGGLAIVLAVVMTVATITTFTKLHEAAQNNGETPILAKYADKPYLGLFGIIIQAAKGDEASLEQLTQEMSLLDENTVMSIFATQN